MGTYRCPAALLGRRAGDQGAVYDEDWVGWTGRVRKVRSARVRRVRPRLTPIMIQAMKWMPWSLICSRYEGNLRSLPS